MDEAGRNWRSIAAFFLPDRRRCSGCTALRLGRIGKRQPIYDIVIHGGSSAGGIAAVYASRLAKRAILINPYDLLGGMTASGLSSVDLGNATTCRSHREG